MVPLLVGGGRVGVVSLGSGLGGGSEIFCLAVEESLAEFFGFRPTLDLAFVLVVGFTGVGGGKRGGPNEGEGTCSWTTLTSLTSGFGLI